MKSSKKRFGGFCVEADGYDMRILCWTKKKVGKRWKIMYVMRIYERFEKLLYGKRKEER